MTELRSIEEGEVSRDLLNTMWETWPDEQAARFLDKRLRSIEQKQKHHFVEIGLICNEVSDRALFKELGYKSFDLWIITAAPVCRSGAYAAMRALKDLEGIPLSDLIEMPRANIETLRKLSSNVGRTPEVIEAAKTSGERQFKEYLQQEQPQQHVEQTYRIAFCASQGLAKLVEDVLGHLMKTEACTSREEALEAIVTDYCNSNSIWKELEG